MGLVPAHPGEMPGLCSLAAWAVKRVLLLLLLLLLLCKVYAKFCI